MISTARYIVITSGQLDELAEVVAQRRKDDYELVGGIAMAVIDGRVLYAQAMIWEMHFD